MSEEYFEEPLVKPSPLAVVNHSGKLDEITEAQMNGELEITPEKKSIRQTGLRWVMLTFGCIFLMGSYFCYDIPSVAQNTFQNDYYNLSPLQVSDMYTVYSLPNTVLPLLGGIFLDKIGIR